jgi:FkbM family methyltransferase
MVTALEVRARNVLRRVGVEVVPTHRRPEANLLGLHLARLLALHRIDLVLDVGARIGEYGLWLRRNGYRGRIVSFEPVQESADQLRKCAAEDPLWRVEQCALGDTDGTAEINVAEMTNMSSLLPVTQYGRAFQTATQRTETIEVRRLDSVWPSLPEGRVYLKMDTQGFDLRVLAGAGVRISEVMALQTEAAVQVIYDGAPTHLQSLAELERLGFTVSGMFPVTLDDRLALVEYDCVAVRR